MGNSDDDKDSAHSITIKPTQFSESSARGWFAVLEAQFKLKSITVSSTKFYNALSALPPNLVTNIPADVINDENYEKLKNNVIQSYEQTKPEIFEKLAQKTTMTGRPSLYLQELQSLARRAGIDNCQDLIRHKFLSSLPHTISPAVAAQTTLSLTQLGSLADELMPMHNNFCNFTQSQQLSQKSPKHPRERRHSTSSGVSGTPIGLRPFSADQRPKICRAHIYFADRARTCKPWCKYPNKNACRIEPSSRSSSPAPPENTSGGSP